MGRTRFPPAAAAAEAVGRGWLESGGGGGEGVDVEEDVGREAGEEAMREAGEARVDVLFG